MKIKKELSDEVHEALSAHGEWAKPSFGNGWAGFIYATIVAWVVVLIGATGGTYLTPIITGVWLAVQFWVLCKYDKTVVSFWNEREKERVVAQWITKNIDRVMEDDTQVIELKGNLDGTNEDE